MKVVPIVPNTARRPIITYVDLFSHMQSIVSNGYFAIPQKGNEQLNTQNLT
jgi:hypothetical protein